RRRGPHARMRRRRAEARAAGLRCRPRGAGGALPALEVVPGHAHRAGGGPPGPRLHAGGRPDDVRRAAAARIRLVTGVKRRRFAGMRRPAHGAGRRPPPGNRPNGRPRALLVLFAALFAASAAGCSSTRQIETERPRPATPQPAAPPSDGPRADLVVHFETGTT